MRATPLPYRLSSFAHHALWLVPALIALTGLSGCRGKARDDFYRQKMASEIRVLEDQLYAADYENRVLHDKLERQRQRDSRDQASESGSREPSQRSNPSPNRAKPTVPGEPSIKILPNAIGSLPDEAELELPEVSPGEATSPSDLAPIIDPGQEAGNRTRGQNLPEVPPSEPTPLTDPDLGFDPTGQPEKQLSPEKKPGQPDTDLLPAPGGPEPPGKNDTDPAGVIPGEVLPPPENPELDRPPGQIELPDSVQSTNEIPTGLRIHPSLSGGHHIEEENDGVMIVVNVIDQLGKTIDVLNFDIDGDLSIVVLDPKREPHQAKLGRWDFKGSEISAFVRNQPISGLHVPLQWKSEKPLGEEVIVHVRLRGEEDEMRCEHQISIKKPSVMARWLPRGAEIK
ncbi:MAG: hypothetical protein ACPGLY_17530 [Rubripirellula sp.]